MKRMRAVESDSVKSARKAKDKLHKACERASETRERLLHRLEQHRMRMRESETFEQTVQRKERLRRIKDWVQLFCARCLNYPWGGRYRTTNRKPIVSM